MSVSPNGMRLGQPRGLDYHTRHDGSICDVLLGLERDLRSVEEERESRWMETMASDACQPMPSELEL